MAKADPSAIETKAIFARTPRSAEGTLAMIKIRHLAAGSAMVLALAAATASAQTRAPAETAAAEAAAWPGLPPGASEAYAVLRDGARLAANVYKPGGRGPWPVVLSRTPYLKDGRRTDGNPNPSEQLAKQARRYTDAGYVFVVQDVRGKGR